MFEILVIPAMLGGGWWFRRLTKPLWDAPPTGPVHRGAAVAVATAVDMGSLLVGPYTSAPAPEYHLRHRKPRAAMPVAVRSPVEPIFFRDGEPQTLEDFGSQGHIVAELDAAIKALDATDQMLDYPHLFLGPPGLGKTLLAKVLANELKQRAEALGLAPVQLFEAFPADIPDVDRLDDIIRRCHQTPGSVLFIDEIHDLTEKHARKLYEVLANHRYQFKGAAHPVVLQPFSLLAATTDYGCLHPALKRRWQEHHFEPATPDQLYQMVLERAQPPIDPGAADLIVARTKFGGAPWEALGLLRVARTMAKARGGAQITVADVQEVLRVQRIDELGLRWLDRKVLAALFKSPRYRIAKGVSTLICYAASEQDTCMLAGVDKGEYRDVIFPKLMSRGLLTKRPTYGQSLTPKALELYGHLAEG